MKHHLFCDIQFNLDTNMQKKHRLIYVSNIFQSKYYTKDPEKPAEQPRFVSPLPIQLEVNKNYIVSLKGFDQKYPISTMIYIAFTKATSTI